MWQEHKSFTSVYITLTGAGLYIILPRSHRAIEAKKQVEWLWEYYEMILYEPMNAIPRLWWRPPPCQDVGDVRAIEYL